MCLSLHNLGMSQTLENPCNEAMNRDYTVVCFPANKVLQWKEKN